MIQRTILEWRSLPYGPDPASPETIPDWAADRIAAVAAASALSGGGTGVLEHGRKALRARGVVGVIAAEGCALEILPKIDMACPPEGRTPAIRRRLIHMLAVALDLTIEAGALSTLDWQDETILEILIRLFADKLADALRQGMPRAYLGEEDDLRALRGSLDVVQQFTRHAVNPSRLACRFDELSPDIALNRIMKAAVQRLLRATRSLRNQRRLQELSLAYADIADIPVPRLDWDAVRIDRTNRRWSELLALARLLLSDRFQTTTSGDSRGFALLFDMNVLFESYVGQLVRRALAGSGFQVSLQGGRLFCLTEEETGRAVFQTRPDILIRQGGAVVHVVDTKWKRIAAQVDDPKRGVSQADVYQMMAYAQVYDAPLLTLLFPHHDGLPLAEGGHARHKVGQGEARLQTMTFDVALGVDAVARLRAMLLPTSAPAM
ncbi:McrC family protein [Maliponia aquimaris]|uniref:5-methylcytosine-specific restriction enzyme subunit McrC n=1 Tax=Maliponia aquimaris TaxID=1673631 RepID=A0A238KW04_9RHOB|nr:restriction endonuclease [Maliponia aquimaris]SMX46236.1 5-methylcytosine-specific restriction enzyme subunit McrC [Maliponia aquimaris]